MRSVSASFAAIVQLLALLAMAACSSEGGSTGTGGSGGGGDGKYHPAGNGQHQTEAAACDALRQAQDARTEALQCTATSRPCPTLIQVMASGTACLEYDQGSVQGCVDHYNQQASCADLAKAVDLCVVTSFAGSEPSGCP